MKKLLKFLLTLILIVVVIAACYVAYVFVSYHRIGDNVELEVAAGMSQESPKTDTEYKIVAWNIGFGAYESDFGFFMDGGTESWAWSKDRLKTNLENIGKALAEQKAEFNLLQEVDIDGTRTYHTDERRYMQAALVGQANTFAQNYDSPFLMYPILQPHGANKSGIMTFTTFKMSSAVRRELPVETGFSKILDLDRCYSASRIPTDNGKELVLYNFHLSAYTSDGTIATDQLKLLLADMQEEYKKGNYCIAGGDFNKDVLGDSSEYFGKSEIEYTWAQPIPAETFEGSDMTIVAPIDKANPVPTCRNADGPYRQGQYVLTIDGFLISPNVEMVKSDVVNTEFAYSDHNPVYMTFKLK